MLLRLKIRDNDGDAGYTINPMHVTWMRPANLKNFDAGTIILLKTNDELFCLEPIDIAQNKWETALEIMITVMLAEIRNDEISNLEEE